MKPSQFLNLKICQIWRFSVLYLLLHHKKRLPTLFLNIFLLRRFDGKIWVHRTIEFAYTELNHSTLSVCRAEKRAAWRQARLKSLEQDSIQAQIMIQSLQLPALEESIVQKKRKNETVEETDGQDELVSLLFATWIPH